MASEAVFVDGGGRRSGSPCRPPVAPRFDLARRYPRCPSPVSAMRYSFLAASQRTLYPSG